MIATIFLLLVVAAWIYWGVATGLTFAFFRHPRKADSGFEPPVSILKPLRGLDAEIYQNFCSFCRQDYPEYELLFGVADPDDPVVPMVERLQQDFPECNIRLIIAPATWVNRKASLLHALATEARHDVLAISDSDVRVKPDYLRRVVAPLADRHVGLVTCLYRGRKPFSFTAKLEALYMGTTFLPSVLVARKFLRMRFAMGATVVLRKSDLGRIGGFAAIGDYLADDYQLGVKIADLGLDVRMSDYITDIVLGVTTFREQWDREVRWAHCHRVSRPLEYPGLLLTFATPFAILFLIASGFSLQGWEAFGATLVLRWLVGWSVTGYTDNRAVRRWLLFLPLRDLLTATVWAVGAFGRHVVWRGEQYLLEDDGRLSSPKPVGQWLLEGGCPSLLKKVIRGVDHVILRLNHIEPYAEEEKCMFRLSLGRAKHELVLSDGTRLRRGDPIAELHLWNEHVPPIPEEGAGMGWALDFYRRVVHSLRLLAAYLEDEPDLVHIRAIGSEFSFGARYDQAGFSASAERLGFDTISQGKPNQLWERFKRFWVRWYAIALMWAYNPNSFRHGNLPSARRDQLWMSREVLVRKYSNRRRPPEARPGTEPVHPQAPEPAPYIRGRRVAS